MIKWNYTGTQSNTTMYFRGGIKCLEYSPTQLSIRQFVEMYFQSYLPATCFGSYNWSHLQAELLG
jgi:hypothetical protein